MESKKARKRQRKRAREVSATILQEDDNTQQSIRKKKCDDVDSPWNFEVEYNDHFETPKIAYSDLIPVLEQSARDNNKSLAELVVYDPYYCAGQMVSFLHELGVQKVINRNRDFYADVEANDIPEYDILVTNPPYSGEHKQRLLQYLSTTSHKPFCLLLPVYVAAKSYWRDFVASEKSKRESHSAGKGQAEVSHTSANSSSKLSSKALVSSGTPLHELYLLPSASYEYNHPEGTGKALPPFFSSWFIGGGFRSLQAVRKAILSPDVNLDRCLAVSTSVENLMKRGVISSDSVKRPNPRQRKKNRHNNKQSNK